MSHAVRPLQRRDGEPVLVDGHPICAACGGPAGLVHDERWRHVPANAPWPPRSHTPLTWPRLRRVPTYAAFTARFPWAASTVSPSDWSVAMSRLAAYHEPSTSDNPLLELVTRLLGDPPRPPTPGLARLLDLVTRRRELAARYAWAIPDEAALAELVALGPLVETGAGTGYWAALITARGGDVVAYDLAPPGGPVPNGHHPGRHTWTTVRPGDSVPAVRAHPDRTLVLCWPPFEGDAGYRAIHAYRGAAVAYVGDARATGTPRLHRELALNWTPESTIGLPSWPGVADRLVVFRRNPVRRPHTTRDRCDECRRYVPTGAIGRCTRCRQRHPAALTLQVGEHRLEYPAEVLAAMPPALATALRNSVHRVDSVSATASGK
jgi:hypothetical protein